MILQKSIVFIGGLVLTACVASGTPVWSAIGLVNRQDGIVVVWREAVYGGGDFNGFDRNERYIEKAAYRAFSIAEGKEGLRSSAISIDHEYRHGGADNPSPNFHVRHDKVLAMPCTEKTDPLCGSPAMRQLGRRGEAIFWNGNILVIDAADDKECRLDLSSLITDAIAEEPSPALTGTYHPRQRVLYLVRQVGDGFEILQSQNCAPPRILDAPLDLAAALPKEVRRAKDFRIQDIVPGSDMSRPLVLFDWTSPIDGIYRERAGVIDLATGKLSLLPIDAPRPIGFWADGSEVMLSADLEVVENTGRLELSLYEPGSGVRRILSATTPLR